jgi:glycosyltransferase involved in cell wall biosynthesis
VKTLVSNLPDDSELILVENGSSDQTKNVISQLAMQYNCAEIKVISISSLPGLGNALRMGFARSRGKIVAFMADDLPFGIQEIELSQSFNLLEADVLAVSKYLQDSLYKTSKSRTFASAIFRMIRKKLLPVNIYDTQGSFVGDGNALRTTISKTKENGFLFTTEVYLLASKHELRINEVPCRSTEVNTRPSTVRVRDLFDMLSGFQRLRSRHLGFNHIDDFS